MLLQVRLAVLALGCQRLRFDNASKQSVMEIPFALLSCISFTDGCFSSVSWKLSGAQRLSFPLVGSGVMPQPGVQVRAQSTELGGEVHEVGGVTVSAGTESLRKR